MGEITEKSKIEVKYDWYQTEANVVVNILAKNVLKDKTEITYEAQSVHIKLALPDDEEHIRTIALAEPINPHQCSYTIMSTKVEIKLLKLIGGRWDNLEATPKSAAALDGPPKYPTSKPGKNWNEIERELKQQEATEEPVAEEALNRLFQDIYGNGDENVKRAMNKSYTESCGTVLSTNWSEIKKNKVDIKPPNEVDYKTWDA